MKVNEKYNLSSEKKDKITDLMFRKAESSHMEAVFDLMAYRNPKMNKIDLRRQVEREINEFSDGKRYGVFVAVQEEKVLGFCRFYFSSDVPKEKIKYSHPEGCYCMGIVVHPGYRRKGVAKFLSQKRFEWLRSLGVDKVFSIVDSENLTSINMHKSLGFEERQRAAGFMNIGFEGREGILFQQKL